MQEAFNHLVTKTIKPFLKAHGFYKKGMYFYKKDDDLIFMLNFQKSQFNSAENLVFYVNFGIYTTSMDTLLGRDVVLEPKISDGYVIKRLDAITCSNNPWYTINHRTNVDELAILIEQELVALVRFVETMTSLEDLVNFMIRENGLHRYEELFEYLLIGYDFMRLVPYIQHLYKRFGHEERWSIFAKNLNTLLQKHQHQESIETLINKKIG